MPAVSKAQAGLLGSIIAGIGRSPTGLSKTKAREILRGTKVKDLPRFANSPVSKGLLDSMRGRTPVSLKSDEGDFHPHISLNLDKFPIVASSRLGDKFALLLRGEVESLHRETGMTPRGRIRILDAVATGLR